MIQTCDRLGWPDEDQDDDNPCECGLPKGHDGLHECHSGCGAQWAGGRNPEPTHWIGDTPTSLHANGPASFDRTTRDASEVTCKLCLTLLTRPKEHHD